MRTRWMHAGKQRADKKNSPTRLGELQQFLRAVPWRALLPACTVLISGSWVADAVKGEVLFADSMKWLGAPVSRWPGMFVAILLFLGATLLVYRNRRDFVPVRSLSRHVCEPHRSLVLFLSPSPVCPIFDVDSLHAKVPINGENTVCLTRESLRDDIEALDGSRWNWQQMLRAIEPHADRLERLHLVGSSGPSGSCEQLATFELLVKGYFKSPELKITKRQGRGGKGVDFEDFNALLDCVRAIIKEEKGRGYSDEDIVIDVTGGFKTTSIAGSSVTFSTNVTFQYVQTQSPNEVYAYDVIHLSHRAAEG